MPEGNGAVKLFSPLDVLRQSLSYTAANLPSVVLWALPSLVYGLGFHFLRPILPGGGEGEMNVSALLVLGFILLWIRVPMEVRLIRSVLLGEVPKQLYGLELLDKRTWSYVWAYARVICLVVVIVGPAFVLTASSLEMLMGSAQAGAQAAGGADAGFGPAATLVGSMALFVAAAVFLVPRVVVTFPDVAVGGKGSLFTSGRLGEMARRSRWRILAVMAVVWAPEHGLNILALFFSKAQWWQDMSDQWWFTLCSYLLGFATLVVSCVAGAMIYGHLRSELAALTAPAREEE